MPARKYRVTIEVDADTDDGWGLSEIYELYDEAASSFGNFSARVSVVKVEPPKVRICQNCQKEDPYDDHWDDLDGPNRAGYSCQRFRPSLADDVKAMKEKLKK